MSEHPGISLARRIIKLDKDSEFGLPCHCCERRDDSGRFQPHNYDCPKSLVTEAKRAIKASKPQGATP